MPRLLERWPNTREAAPQAVFEHMLRDVAEGVNKSSNESPLESKSERWSGEDDHGEPRKKKRKRGHGPTEQPELPTQEVLFELDEADRVCPACGGELKAIEGLTEDATEIDVVEVKYLVRTVKKPKYRCTCSSCQHLEKATETLDRILGDFEGKLIADSLSSYIALRGRRELAYERLETERKPSRWRNAGCTRVATSSWRCAAIRTSRRCCS